MRWLCPVLITFTFGFSLIACNKADAPEQQVILVRIPPYFDPKLTSGENHCVFSYWWHPPTSQIVDTAKLCKGAGLPNDGVPITVSLKEDNSILINMEANGNLSDVSLLVKRLSNIFQERRINGVYEERSEKIEKSVGLRIPASTRYEDAFKIAIAVKESGADPIILLLDGHLPQQVITLAAK